MLRPLARTGAAAAVLVVAVHLGSTPAQAKVAPRVGAAPKAGISRIQQFGPWINVAEAYLTRADAARALTILRQSLTALGGDHWIAQIETLSVEVFINGVLTQAWLLRWRKLV